MKHSNKAPILVILAGGKSTRMKQPKGLLPFKNSFWILWQIETFIGSEICIGLGYDHQLYFNAVPWLKNAVQTPINYKNKNIRVVINPTPALGPFSNLQAVLKHVDSHLDIIFLHVDVPLFHKAAQKKLFATNNLLVIPKYKGKKGHPIKINAALRNAILGINPEAENARLDRFIKTKKTSEISFIEVTDALCTRNLNTPKDWQNFISN